MDKMKQSHRRGEMKSRIQSLWAETKMRSESTPLNCL